MAHTHKLTARGIPAHKPTTRKLTAAALAFAALIGGGTTFAAPTFAAPDGSNVVINEVYVRGGNADGVYQDYVELYNPTDKAIPLEGWSIQYFSASGTKGSGNTPLSGSIDPNGYFLVLGPAAATHTTNLEGDVSGGFNASGTSGTLVLFSSSTQQTITQGNLVGQPNVVDAVGFGAAKSFETQPAAGTTKAGTAYVRRDFADTDDNSKDFVVGDATPQGSKDSGSTPTPTPEPTATAEPTPTPEPTPTADPTPTPTPQLVTIADIQGKGDTSPLVGQTVTTRGFVTADYADGGFNGFYVQTAGTGSDNSDGISDAVFVYGSKAAASVTIGDYVEVTGKVSEYMGLTEMTASSCTELTPDADVVAPKPLEFAALPTDSAAREAIEGMLVKITEPYTVSNNYSTSQYGEVGVVAGTEPVRQPSDYITSDKQAELAAAAQAAKDAVWALDDGSSANLTNFNLDNDWIPAPYLNVNDPLLVGSQISFLQPMVVDFRNNAWKIQPTEPINAKDDDGLAPYTDNTDKWVNIQNNEQQPAPGDFGGDVTVSSFNVLNYFTDLGQNEPNCKYYADRDGGEVTTNWCDVRGAWGADDLARQQSKIVAAINDLNSSITGLEEIENSAKFGHDRDASLNTLVAALNKAAGYNKWAAVPSPAADQLPALDKQDVIRVAFIYQPAQVQPVGDSKVLVQNTYFDNWARQPLGQGWQALNADGTTLGDPFAVVLNHFKSKGSLADVFPNDTDPYAGNNNKLRTAEAKEMADWAATQYPDMARFVIGDLNSYSKEDPIITLENLGYTNIAEAEGVTRHSYQFSGLVGSMDHGLANADGMKLVVGADLWNVNAMEPIAFEYSRYNYNVKVDDLFDAASPYRSSDHDPIKFALTFPRAAAPIEPIATVTPLDPKAGDPASCTTKPTVDIPASDNVEYTVNGKVVPAGAFEYEYGTSVTVKATPLNGYAIADGAQTEWSWTAPTLASLKCDAASVEGTPGGETLGDATPGDSSSTDNNIKQPSAIAGEHAKAGTAISAPQSTTRTGARMPQKLARTGADVTAFAGFAAVLLMLGAGATIASRHKH
ncbi:MAG: ExeM/NucH family extracellular endonuclease [Actinomycetaceae bacterium]|nr:ExeM/NucH family extracellular endonuclease [Actinomycetaceae bacterium]MDY6083361.1 ExeM/NucH family extracellular endonuclease [Actinomycetaceae bacterium]